MTYELTLAPTVDCVGAGRRLVGEALSEWGLDALSYTATLLTSEVLTNSLLHARTPIVLTIDGVSIPFVATATPAVARSRTLSSPTARAGSRSPTRSACASAIRAPTATRSGTAPG